VSYGAAVAIYENTPLGPTYGHGGSIPGYTSSMRYYPEHGFAVAYQVNTDEVGDDFGERMDRLAMLVAERLKENKK